MKSSAAPIHCCGCNSDTPLVRVHSRVRPRCRRTPIMREQLMNRTTLDVLLVVLLLAWVL
jgi:hypothetical protein